MRTTWIGLVLVTALGVTLWLGYDDYIHGPTLERTSERTSERTPPEIMTRVDTVSDLTRGIWPAFGRRVTNSDTLRILDLLFEKNEVRAAPASLD